MPIALWYLRGPHAGTLRVVSAEEAEADIAAGLAQNVKKPAGGKLLPAERGRPTYSTRDMQAEPPEAGGAAPRTMDSGKPNKGGRPRRIPVQ